jgi:hypothetical protein
MLALERPSAAGLTFRDRVRLVPDASLAMRLERGGFSPANEEIARLAPCLALRLVTSLLADARSGSLSCHRSTD